jgi:hypothetical protein
VFPWPPYWQLTRLLAPILRPQGSNAKLALPIYIPVIYLAGQGVAAGTMYSYPIAKI